AQEIKVPDIGDFDAVEVIELLVAAGDTVDVEQPLITLESDKSSLEVPTTVAGSIVEMKVKEGDKVSQGDVIAVLEAADSSAATAGDDDDAGAAEESAGDTTAAETSTSEPAAQPQAAAAPAEQDIKVPDIGDFDAVEVIE